MSPPPARLTPPGTVFAWVGARWPGTRAAALFALDETLGGIVRAARQPLVGQMRLTWWHEALEALDRGEVRAHPVLRGLADARLPGAALAAMIDGWEMLLDEAAPEDPGLADHARERGARLFTLAAGQAGCAGLARAGEGWALADLAANVSDTGLAARAAASARDRFGEAFRDLWPATLRPLGALAQDARLAAAGNGDAGSPRRAAAVLRFRLSGR